MSYNLPANSKFEEALLKAIKAFGDVEEALNWLNSPCPELDEQVPLHLLETTDGAQRVMEALERKM